MLRFLLALILSAVSPARPIPTVAITYFDNNTHKPELAPLAKGLADMLITDVGQLSSLQVVERGKLNQVLDELKLSHTQFVNPKTAQRLGKGLAAEYIMTGGYALVGRTLRIDARVVRVETGAVVASEHVEGAEEEFFALEKELVDVLVRALEIRLASTERTKLRSNATQSLAAWKAYAAGLDAEDRGDVARARTAFGEALAADPGYRAARTATERLAAIFARSARQATSSFDDALRAMNPRSPDFAAKVDAMLASMDSAKTEQLGRKVALLTWLAEHDLLACSKTSGPALGNPTVLVGGIPTGGVVSHCPQVQETLILAYRLLEDPASWQDIPRVCEHYIRALPNDRALLGYCESILQSLDDKRKEGAEAARKEQQEDDAWVEQSAKKGDWRRTLLENRPAMRKLLGAVAHRR